MNKHVLNKIHELPFGMAVPLAVLSFASIFCGYFLKKLITDGVRGKDFFEGAIFVLQKNSAIIQEAEFLPLYIKILPTVFSLVGFFFSLFFYSGLFVKQVKF